MTTIEEINDKKELGTNITLDHENVENVENIEDNKDDINNHEDDQDNKLNNTSNSISLQVKKKTKLFPNDKKSIIKIIAIPISIIVFYELINSTKSNKILSKFISDELTSKIIKNLIILIFIIILLIVFKCF